VCSVLIVDDDSQQLAIRRLLLEAAGHEAAVADSMPEAKRLLEELRPDLLLMDLRLPELADGLSLIRSVGERRLTAKIIVLSGWTEDLYDLPEVKLVARVLGKPIRHEQLLAAINAVVSWPARNLPSSAS
jgi:DNA-binding response OmpR family regulator